jgi:AraC family transcriptional regulator
LSLLVGQMAMWNAAIATRSYDFDIERGESIMSMRSRHAKGMIAHVITFAAHRRTLVAGALADAGIKDLGAGDPMRWVAEPA